MLADWREQTEAEKLRRTDRPNELFRPSDNRAAAIAAQLLRTGAVAGVEAVAERFSQQSAMTRHNCYEALAYRAWPDNRHADRLPPPEPGYWQAVEKLLLTAIDDCEHRHDRSFLSFDSDNWTIRACDLAAFTLHAIAPERYAFDLSESIHHRDAALFAIKNQDRMRQGQAPLAPPQTSPVVALSDEEAAPLIEPLVSGDESAWDQAADALIHAGVPALSAVKKRLAMLDSNDAAAGRLQAVARKMAAIVTQVQRDDRSPPVAALVQQRLNALVGKPLTAKDMLEPLLEHLQGSDAFPEFQIVAVRIPGQGVQIVYRLTGKLGDEKYEAQFHRPVIWFCGSVDNREILNGWNNCEPMKSPREKFGEQLKFIDETLAAGDETAVELYAAVRR